MKTTGIVRRLDELGVWQGLRGRDDGAVPVVLAVDAQHLEPRGERLDLPEEVLGREAALTERSGQGVRRRRDRDVAVSELTQESRHQHGVARVVELELVDADQVLVAERLDGRGEPERSDEVRVLDERAERGTLRPERVRERREQVRLADPEPAVEVHRGHAPAAPSQQGAEPARGRHEHVRDLGETFDGALLARVRRVRTVGRERRVGEVPRRDEVTQEARAIGGRTDVAERRWWDESHPASVDQAHPGGCRPTVAA